MIFHEHAKNWEPPDGLGYSSLRPVQLSGAGIAMSILSVVFLVGGVVLGVKLANQSTNDDERRRLLREQGVDATAVITRVWRTDDNESKPMVSYRFDAGQGKASAPKRIWEGLAVGGPLAIRYVPARPQINHPAEWEMSRTPIGAAWAAGGVLVWPPFLFVFMIRRQMRLLSEGRPAPGVVTRVRRTDKSTSIYYEFTLLSGAVMKGRSGGGRKSPGVGQPCCVLYDPDNPKRNSIYPMTLVKLSR